MHERSNWNCLPALLTYIFGDCTVLFCFKYEKAVIDAWPAGSMRLPMATLLSNDQPPPYRNIVPSRASFTSCNAKMPIELYLSKFSSEPISENAGYFGISWSEIKMCVTLWLFRYSSVEVLSLPVRKYLPDA